MTERIVLAAIFGCAAVCALVYYFFTLPLLSLISLILLNGGYADCGKDCVRTG